MSCAIYAPTTAAERDTFAGAAAWPLCWQTGEEVLELYGGLASFTRLRHEAEVLGKCVIQVE
ncbi:MAG: hypothetical protein AAGK00_07395 [Pseudomonadota bacterium]